MVGSPLAPAACEQTLNPCSSMRNHTDAPSATGVGPDGRPIGAPSSQSHDRSAIPSPSNVAFDPKGRVILVYNLELPGPTASKGRKTPN